MLKTDIFSLFNEAVTFFINVQPFERERVFQISEITPTSFCSLQSSPLWLDFFAS
jgi:hypothetical protein